MACVIDPLVNGFTVLLDACQLVMQKYIMQKVHNFLKPVGFFTYQQV